MSEKDADLLEGLNLIDNDELAEEVPGDEVDAMANIVDLLDDDDAPESGGLKVVTDGSEIVESPPVTEAQPESVEPPPGEKSKKKRNKPRKVTETKAVNAPEPADTAITSVGAVVLDAGILRIRASKVVIEAEKIEFSS